MSSMWNRAGAVADLFAFMVPLSDWADTITTVDPADGLMIVSMFAEFAFEPDNCR